MVELLTGFIREEVRALSDIAFREVKPEEVDQARRLILAGLQEHFGFVDKTLNPDLKDIAACYLDRGYPFLVAVKNGRVVGTGALVHVDSRTAQIVRVSVAADQRRQGIARKLVELLLGEAEKRGYARVVVETCKDWQDAVGLYLSCGFSKFCEDQDDVYLHYQLK